jgi:hypothetical protein
MKKEALESAIQWRLEKLAGGEMAVKFTRGIQNLIGHEPISAEGHVSQLLQSPQKEGLSRQLHELTLGNTPLARVGRNAQAESVLKGTTARTAKNLTSGNPVYRKAVANNIRTGRSVLRNNGIRPAEAISEGSLYRPAIKDYAALKSNLPK